MVKQRSVNPVHWRSRFQDQRRDRGPRVWMPADHDSVLTLRLVAVDIAAPCDSGWCSTWSMVRRCMPCPGAPRHRPDTQRGFSAFARGLVPPRGVRRSVPRRLVANLKFGRAISFNDVRIIQRLVHRLIHVAAAATEPHSPTLLGGREPFPGSKPTAYGTASDSTPATLTTRADTRS